ncbi:metalloregulator ArsR/SmtB family transcription factor [Luteimonas sp. M1R5S18]|uniref:Metalloregulator ArsR/SmtB family transcription factor n=1 Tax=Luteimonas rhizosphaericola TaxID=3042024 RepID=A0ABT6JEA0_9GAMM|nr:metalloregulator ArsR/SmtB family transcription factor [Luteimonas rhizosphaericola]MDH5829001.1 metalloregulator ArsR/SmtB family transcription factor [Luteimonas rhizosphaericola]
MAAAPGNPGFDLQAMQAHAGDAARLLKALANERRLQVLCLLAGGERSVGELNELLDLSQSALSQHLAVLREEQLVDTRRESQTIYYALAPGPAAAVMQTLHGIYCAPPTTRRKAPTRPARAPSSRTPPAGRPRRSG